MYLRDSKFTRMALMMCEQLTSYDLREFRRSEACTTEDSDGQWSSFYNFEEIEDVVKWHSQDFEAFSLQVHHESYKTTRGDSVVRTTICLLLQG